MATVWGGEMRQAAGYATCFYWSNGEEHRLYPWDAVRVGVAEPSTTEVRCSAANSTCTAKVSGAPPPKTPAGSVTFSVTAISGTAGSFKEPTCELKASATPGTAECSAAYTKPASGAGQAKISAAYGGDAEFAASSGSVTECGDAATLGLESIHWVGRHDHGFQLNSEVVLHGCGFSTSTIITWGNTYARETVEAADINPEGTEIKTTLPWEATSGNVTVTDGSESATLTEQPIDTWRDTDGFDFENFDRGTTAQDLSEAFVDPVLDAEGDPLPDYYSFLEKWETPHALCSASPI